MVVFSCEQVDCPEEQGCEGQSVGKHKDLKLNSDGSVTFYVQADPPQGDQRKNWLPAPKDEDFSLFMRAYWPKIAALDGTWTPPAVEKQN